MIGQQRQQRVRRRASSDLDVTIVLRPESCQQVSFALVEVGANGAEPFKVKHRQFVQRFSQSVRWVSFSAKSMTPSRCAR